MRSIIPATFALAAVLATGCAATVASDGYGPDLVTVSPGVQVIADYDEPIFYTDGFYWRYDGGVWYRSSYYTGGWVYARPPVAVLRIDRPYGYRYYRPAGYVGRRPYAAPPPASGWRGSPASAPGYRGAPPPAASGWRGGPTPAPGYRGAPPPAAARRPPPPQPVRPAPPPARAAPQRSGGNGWHGGPR